MNQNTSANPPVPSQIEKHLRESLDRLALTAQNLQMSKLHFQAVLNSMIEGIIVIDLDGIIQAINPEAKRILHIPEPKQSPVKSAICLSDFKKGPAKEVISILEEVLNTRSILHREAKISSDSTVYVRLNVTPIQDWSNKTTGFVVVLHDITRDKEREINQREFLSVASHELRSPLSIAKEGIHIILSGAVDKSSKATYKKILNTVSNNLDRLLRLINDLLDLSKMEAGKVQLNKKERDFCQIVQTSVEPFHERINKQGLKFSIISPKDLYIHVDQDKIIQIITNLISNAIKFTKKGSIKIHIRKTDENGVECSIADSGCGLKPDDVPHLFDKYKQFGQKSLTGEKGSGLGLAIVKEIVEAHEGVVWAESRLNEGTTFTFELPEGKDPKNTES